MHMLITSAYEYYVNELGMHVLITPVLISAYAYYVIK